MNKQNGKREITIPNTKYNNNICKTKLIMNTKQTITKTQQTNTKQKNIRENPTFVSYKKGNCKHTSENTTQNSYTKETTRTNAPHTIHNAQWCQRARFERLLPGLGDRERLALTSLTK